MITPVNKSSRRSFVTRGGVALGAGLAATAAGGAVAAAAQPHPASGDPADREALRQLQLAFHAHLESGRYAEAAALFAPDATLDLSGETARGAAAIGALLERYRRQEAAVLHRAYRQSPAQQQRDSLAIVSGARATATYHLDAELCTPLQVDCTVARMAQLQGGFAARRWESGRMDAAYVKTAGQWQLASLSYRPA